MKERNSIIFLIINITYLLYNNLYAENISYKILKPSNSPIKLSLKDALNKSLLENYKILLAKNSLEQKQAQRISYFFNFLPKLKLDSNYTRNIPVLKYSFDLDEGDQKQLFQKVSELLAKNTDPQGAADLQIIADKIPKNLGQREILIAPKNLFETKISIEIPLFNGPDLLNIIKSNNLVNLEQNKFNYKQAENVYNIAKNYIKTFYYFKIYELKDNLITKNQYRFALGELGSQIGLEEEFILEDPTNISIKLLDKSEEELINIALLEREDIKAQQQALNIAQKENSLAFMHFLPTLNLSAGANYTSNIKGLISKHWSYDISLNLHWSILEGPLRFGLLKENSFKKTKEELKLKLLVRELGLSLRGHKAKLEELKLEILNKENALKINKNKEQKLNAQIALLQSQSELTQELLNLSHELGLLAPLLP